MFEFWNNLPEELKLECIKWMDLKTRIKLGGTCHNERLLVPRAEKLSMEFMQILSMDFTKGALRLSFKFTDGAHLCPGFEDENQIQEAGKPLLLFIFQNCKKNYEMLDGLEASRPFDIRKMMGVAPLEFLRKCSPNCFKIVDYNNLCHPLPISVEELMELPSFQSAKSWRLQFKECHDFGAFVAKKWIQLDVDVKSTMEFKYDGEDGTIDDFVKEMGDINIIEKNENLVRFKTGNEKKHMTMRRMHYVYKIYLFTLAVIPADLEEKNYESYIDI